MAKWNEVATFNAAMMSQIEDEQGTVSPLAELATLKVYNPKMGAVADPELAGKFKLTTPDKQEHILDGEIELNILEYAFFYSGEFFPDNGSEKVFAITSEFGPFAKKTDTLDLIIDKKYVGKFERGQFEEMIKSPTLNGGRNYFHTVKKNVEGRPYDSSEMTKRVVLYAQIISGPFAGTLIRMYTNPSKLGKTFVDGNVVNPDEGTILYAIDAGLPEMRKINPKTNRLSARFVDMKISIYKNEKGNFLINATYKSLTGFRTDNTEVYNHIQSIRKEVNVRNADYAVTSIMIADGKANVSFSDVKQIAHPTHDIGSELALVDDSMDIFAAEVKAPSVLNQNDDLTIKDVPF